MNADLQKLRDSRLFRNLPDRAFERVKQYIKVRAFEKGELVQDFRTDKTWQLYFGYVLSGQVLFLGKDDKPLGLAFQDEFFLGRAFSMGEHRVEQLLSAHAYTLVVYIRKEVFEVLASASQDFAQVLEDIYDSIYERAEMMLADIKGVKAVKEWIKAASTDETLSAWIVQIEKKREQIAQKKQRERKERLRILSLWSSAAVIAALVCLETYANIKNIPLSLTYILTGSFAEFDPGSNFNIALGIIGYILIVSTNLHTFFKWSIRKLKWKINYKLSSQLHMIFGVLGAFFILFHSAFHIEGGNIAHYALYAIFVGIMSGVVGQVISSQIPKSIRGEKLKLDSLQKEQAKLKQQAELLMDDHQYKTSVALMAKPVSSSFWGALFGIPRLWIRQRRIRHALKSLGMGRESAGLAAQLLAKEFRLRQKIRGLEIANQIFRRWMLIHKPFGYAVYILGTIHIIIVVFLA